MAHLDGEPTMLYLSPVDWLRASTLLETPPAGKS
jgi:hypothetical protein